MTLYQPPIGQRLPADLTQLFRDVAVLKQQLAVAAGAYAAFPCTSSTRPASPNVGQEVYETDTGNTSVWTGTAWETMVHEGAWTAYTPTWSAQTVNPALGNGTLAGRYCKIGRQVTVSLLLVAGSTTTFGTGLWFFSLPATPNNAQVDWFGPWWAITAGALVTAGTAMVSSTVVVMPIGAGTANYMDATHPFAWASGCQLGVQITYESTS